MRKKIAFSKGRYYQALFEKYAASSRIVSTKGNSFVVDERAYRKISPGEFMLFSLWGTQTGKNFFLLKALRPSWKRLLEKAKAHPGLSSHGGRKKIQVESVTEPDEIGNVIEEIINLARQINLEADSNDVKELLNSHNHELSIEDLIETYEQEQDIEEFESIDSVVKNSLTNSYFNFQMASERLYNIKPFISTSAPLKYRRIISSDIKPTARFLPQQH
ncbi:hypothetical protein TNCV_518111 [Trichonephila clavipes]|nr:hypothetical protein TNCV_518111 [Trichonephila clavipes]